MGGDAFCFKVCDPSRPNAANFCQHIYDRIGCAYNAPNNAQNGTFEACAGENQDFPGIYTVNGAVLTYTQPPEALGVITTLPYQPRVPASSNCVPFQSASLFAALATVTPSGSAVSSASQTLASSGSGAAGTRSSSSGTGTDSAQNANQTQDNGGVIVMAGVVSLFGVVFSALFLS